MTRHLGLVVAALAVVPAAVAGVPVANAADPDSIVVRHGRTQPVFSYPGAVRETVYVRSTMDSDGDGRGDLLATDIIRPRQTETGDLKVPVIYENSPYYQFLGRGNESETKDAEDGDFTPDFFPLFYDNYFVPRGYAVVLQDMSGTRNSEGCMVLGGRAEVAAARATVDWLNGRGAAFTASGERVDAQWSTGSVGMIGKSYDGTIANATAATGVEGLETIVPIAAISRWYDYHLNNGVQYPNAYLTPALFSFLIDQTPADDEERGRQWLQATVGRSATCQATGAEIVARAGDPRADYTAFWDERDYLRRADDVSASVFAVHGLNDLNVKVNHFDQWWRALARNGVPRKVWLSQTGHVDPFDFRRRAWVATLHRWFDRELHGIRNGIMAEPTADVERDADHWGEYADWPAPSAHPVTLHLGPARGTRPGVLTTRPTGTGQTQAYRDDPLHGEQQMASHRRERKPSRLLFVSPRLTGAVRTSGTPLLDIRASVDRRDTNFTALLVDYGTDRRVDYQSSGEGVRTTRRHSCHGRSTAADDACYLTTKKVTHRAPYEIVSRGWLDARHRQSLRHGEDLVPGKTYRFRWEVMADDYVFEAGHRIGVVIAGSDADQTVSDPSGATVTVELGASRLVLPVVDGVSRYTRSTP